MPAMSSPAAPLAEGSPVRFSSGKYCNRNLTGTILKLTLLAAITSDHDTHALVQRLGLRRAWYRL